MVAMTAGGMNEKPENDDAVTYDILSTCDQITVKGSERTKERKTRKYLICAATVICVTALILIAVIVGTYFILFNTQRIRNQYRTVLTDESDSNRTISRQETTVYDDLLEQHITTGDRHLWQLIDYNRELVVMKVRKGSDLSSEVCYLTPLNRTTIQLSPGNIPYQPSIIPAGSADNYVHIEYASLGHAIVDHTILGVKGQELCLGINVYWTLPTYTAPKSEETSKSQNSTLIRRKRQSGVYPFPGFPCSYLSCTYVSYPGDTMQYLKCERIPCGGVPTTSRPSSTLPVTNFDPSGNRTSLKPDITTSTVSPTSTTVIVITPSSSSASSSTTGSTSTSQSTRTTVITSPSSSIFISSPTSVSVSSSQVSTLTTTRNGVSTSTTQTTPVISSSTSTTATPSTSSTTTRSTSTSTTTSSTTTSTTRTTSTSTTTSSTTTSTTRTTSTTTRPTSTTTTTRPTSFSTTATSSTTSTSRPSSTSRSTTRPSSATTITIIISSPSSVSSSTTTSPRSTLSSQTFTTITLQANATTRISISSGSSSTTLDPCIRFNG